MPEPTTRAYAAAMKMSAPIVRGWGRLQTSGLEALPADGPVLLAGNHDSYWDPVIVGVAALGRRQVRALAKSSLWKVKGLDRLLDGMGQIPITRGSGDAAALDRAIDELRAGACIGIFPEGTRSLGRELRARGGITRLADAVPEAQLVCVSIVGSTEIARFPTRPRLNVRFFTPAAVTTTDALATDAPDLATRLLAEIRAEAPIAAAGRRRRAAG